MTNLLLVQLAALSAHLQSVQMAIEQEMGTNQSPEPGSSCPKCGAGQDKTEDASMLAGPKRRRCQECGEVWEV